MRGGLVGLVSVPLVVGALSLAPTPVLGQEYEKRELPTLRGDPNHLYLDFPGPEEILNTDSLELRSHHVVTNFIAENTRGPRAYFRDTTIPFPSQNKGPNEQDSTMALYVRAGFPDVTKQELKVTVAFLGQKGHYAKYGDKNLWSMKVSVISPLGVQVYLSLESRVVIEEREHVPIRKTLDNQPSPGLEEIEEDSREYVARVARGIVKLPVIIMSIFGEYLGTVLQSVDVEDAEKRYGNRFGDISILNDYLTPTFSGQEYYSTIADSRYYRWRVMEEGTLRYPYLIRIEVNPKATSWTKIQEEDLGFGIAGEIEIIPPQEE